MFEPKSRKEYLRESTEARRRVLKDLHLVEQYGDPKVYNTLKEKQQVELAELISLDLADG